MMQRLDDPGDEMILLMVRSRKQKDRYVLLLTLRPREQSMII